MALFPRLSECSHFHYENVSINPFTVNVKYIETDGLIVLLINTFGSGWQVRRTWSQIVGMDARFHDCIISRATTGLVAIGELFARRSTCSASGVFDDSEEIICANRGSRMTIDDVSLMEDNRDQVMEVLKDYFSVFSTYTIPNINCAPILNFFEMDNHGYRLTVPDEETVNKPAVAAAQVVRRHVAQDSDEITLEVGDFVSIVDMPDGAPWWRAKQGMRVGFFPAECVSIINRDGSKRVSAAVSTSSVSDPSGYKPVALSRGKTMSRLILALFGKSRPTKLELRRSGIIRDRVFGSDLGVYLSATRREVPLPLMVCAQIIEDNGIVDGIYRRSGAQTHVQNLRRGFDEDQRPTIDEDLIKTDIHCFSSLLKTYFGELLTPLFSHAIYKLLRETLSINGEAERLNATFRVISRLPPPYFRTARYLFVHLNKMAHQHTKTLMTAKNLAICWAPNLMKPIAELDYNRPDPSIMAEVRDNPRLVEYIISYAPQLFSDRPPNWEEVLAAKTTRLLRSNFNGLEGDQPNLLSLAEARRRFGCHSVLNVASDEETKTTGLCAKERARSMMVGPSQRDGRDIDGDITAISVVPSSPVLIDPPNAISSPSVANRNRLSLLPSLQQKHQLMQRQQYKQRNSDYRVLSGSTSNPPCEAPRPRSHSLVEAQHGSSLMSEMRQEHAKRRKRLKPSFSTGRSKANRSQSVVCSVKTPESPPDRVGASLFYTRASSVPEAPASPPSHTSYRPPEPPASQPEQRRIIQEKSPSPPPLISGGRNSKRSSFQRLQNSWQRRSVRGLNTRKSSSSSSSSSSESLTPPAGEEVEEDGDLTPKGRQSPVMVVARAVPATAPPPVVPRARSSVRSSHSVESPEYENLEHYRRLSGIVSANFTVKEDDSSTTPSNPVSELPIRRTHSPLPKPRAKRRSHLDGSPSLNTDAQFRRNNPARQSLPTRMDRLLTKFPTEVRCYLPETNV